MALYLDACATTPLAPEAARAMIRAQRTAWANPSSLHGFGIQASECLERSRERIASRLGATPEQVVFCSGGSEAIHAALLGAAATLPPARVVVSAVEHPATLAAVDQLCRQGWQVSRIPVDPRGVVRMDRLDELLRPPTRLASIIWGQNELGTLQPIEAIGRRCRDAGVLLHVDAVQVVGHEPVDFSRLPVDLLSCAAHKLQGPRGIGALLRRPDLQLRPLVGGGGQEGGHRGGTEAVMLAAGFAAALEAACRRLEAHGGRDPVEPLRDHWLTRLTALPGVRLSGCPPDASPGRLPHHLSLLVSTPEGRPLSGRSLVRALWREGFAVSSGSACATAPAAAGPGAPSPVLLALGQPPSVAASGLRLSFGPWLAFEGLEPLEQGFERARQQVMTSSASDR